MMIKSVVVPGLLLAQQTLSSGWNYEHQDEWEDDYSMCDNVDQSPIDILTSQAIDDDNVCIAEFDWDIDFTVQTFKITNNGHSVVLQPVEEVTGGLSGPIEDADGTEYVTLSENDNTIAKFPNYFQPAGSNHDEFCLHSLHFHWGTNDSYGSEHFVDGHQYALEVHFVHYSCEHPDLTSALLNFQTEAQVVALENAGNDTHQLGVVGIFFDVEEGYVNPLFDDLFDNLDDFELPAESGDPDVVVSGLDLSDIVSTDVYEDGYYAYEGSLTTPPCTNIVRWHVMNAKAKIGTAQMEQFRELLEEPNHQIAPNYREIQDQYYNVYACTGVPSSDSASQDDITVHHEGIQAVIEEDPMIRMAVWSLAIATLLAPIILGVVCCRLSKREKARAEAEAVEEHRHNHTQEKKASE